MKKPTISVGICAYNEQVNIANVITSFLFQKETNFILKEIIVVSDGSTDKTVELIEKFGDDRLHLVAHSDRVGKARRLNEIISLFSGDFLLLTDADVLPENQFVFEKIVNKFLEDREIDMVLANVRPLTAVTFFERAINNFFYAREDQVKHFDFYSTIHGARGAGLALTRKVAKKITFPENLIIDDAFIYLFIKQSGYKAVAAKEAVIWFRSVQTIADFKKQIMRYMRGGEQLHNFYNGELIYKTSYIPKHIMIRVLVSQLRRDMIGYLLLKAVFTYCRFYLRFNKYRTTTRWLISKSSKNLQMQANIQASNSNLALNKLWKMFGMLKGVLFLWFTN